MKAPDKNIILSIEDYKNLKINSSLRNIYLFGNIDKESVLDAISQIHLHEYMNNKKDINLYINSDGGFIDHCFALIDVMDNCSCDISTIIVGTAASAACLIASNGSKGKRIAGKNAQFMYHEAYSDLGDVTKSDLKFHISEFEKCQQKLDKIFRRNTGKSAKEIAKNFIEKEYDRYMSAQEAKDFGIVDKIMTTRRNHGAT